jgi:hypothetical protein
LLSFIASGCLSGLQLVAFVCLSGLPFVASDYHSKAPFVAIGNFSWLPVVSFRDGFWLLFEVASGSLVSLRYLDIAREQSLPSLRCCFDFSMTY